MLPFLLTTGSFGGAPRGTKFGYVIRFGPNIVPFGPNVVRSGPFLLVLDQILFVLNRTFGRFGASLAHAVA